MSLHGLGRAAQRMNGVGHTAFLFSSPFSSPDVLHQCFTQSPVAILKHFTFFACFKLVRRDFITILYHSLGEELYPDLYP
jgi:hypothetical protein